MPEFPVGTPAQAAPQVVPESPVGPNSPTPAPADDVLAKADQEFNADGLPPAPPQKTDPATAAPTNEGEQVFGPPVPGDDFSSDFRQHRDTSSGDAAMAELEKEFGTPSQAATEPANPATSGASGAVAKGKSVALDIAHGFGEAASQIPGGMRDAVQNIQNLRVDLGDWLDNHFPGHGVKDFKFHGLPVFGKVNLPEIHGPASTTGALLRGTAQFLTGMAGPGKLVKGAGVAANAARGAVSMFSAFDGHEKRLSNLVEEYPKLKNPVTEYLAASPEDSAMEGRFKNALEGIGLGALTEGMVKAVGLIREARVGMAGERLINPDLAAPSVDSSHFSTIGDPDQGLFAKAQSKMQAGLDSTEGMTAGDVTGKAEKSSQPYINFAKIDTPEDIKTVIQKMASSNAKGISDAARGKRSWEQTKLSADQQDAWKLLMERRQGDAMNAEQSVASRQLWATSAAKLKETADLVQSAPTEANLFQFRKMLAVHSSIQNEVIAARTETARALQAWQIPVGEGKEMASRLSQILEASGGADVATDLAKKISMMNQAGMATGIEKLVQGTALANTRDAVSQVWINALLSNPATHVANGISNFSAAFQQIYERAGAEYITQKLGTENGVALGEAAAMAHGMTSAFRDSLQAVTAKVKGIKNFKDAVDVAGSVFKEQPIGGGSQSKFELPPPGSLSAEKWGIASGTPLGQALDVVDVGTRAPGRLLTASDNFFKSIGYRMELHAQATRLATNEVRGGKIGSDAFKQRVAEIVENPPADVRIEAVNAATYQTFTGKPAEVLKKVGDGIQSIPVLGRLLLPFKNTPINILTYAAERSPLAPLVKSWRSDLAAGGARSDIALARMSSGSLIMATAMDQALSGKFTGKGPEDSGQRANWLRQGNQPYSVRVGDKWVAYNRLDPVGMTIGMAADMAEAIVNAEADVDNEHFEKAMVGAMFAVSNNVLSKTYMQGTSEFFGAVANPSMKGDSYFQKLLGSAVPAGVAATARNGIPGLVEADPYMRTASDGIEALRRRIPGLSKDLPLYRDLWGRTVDYRSGHGWAQDMFSPVYIKKMNPEPVDSELQRLNYYPDMPQKKMQFHGVQSRNSVTIELTGKQYSRLLELSGNGLKDPAFGLGAKDMLNAIVSGQHPLSPVYNLKSDGPDGGKAEYIKFWLNKFRDRAKAKLMEEDPGLQATYDQKIKMKPGKLSPSVMGGGN